VTTLCTVDFNNQEFYVCMELTTNSDYLPVQNQLIVLYNCGMCSWFQTFAVFWMLYAFFWAILFFIPIRLWRWNRQCSETSAYKIQTPGNYPEESIREMCFLRGTDCLCFELMSLFKEIISQYVKSIHTGWLQSETENFVLHEHIHEVPRSHSEAPCSEGLLWTSDRFVV
jgi:hypothetical protein